MNEIKIETNYQQPLNSEWIHTIDTIGQNELVIRLAGEKDGGKIMFIDKVMVWGKMFHKNSF